jgi:hypothetical protein
MGYFNAPGATGAFQEKEHGHWFEYRPTQDEWALEQGLTQEIAVAYGEKRYAQVKKTVAYVAVDENEFGKALIVKWHIRSHNIYSKS